MACLVASIDVLTPLAEAACGSAKEPLRLASPYASPNSAAAAAPAGKCLNSDKSRLHCCCRAEAAVNQSQSTQW